ncbi:MAG: recombinase family protein [Limisphaerales bacterium]
MKEYIGYIRVSTVKQGTKGVSLQEQKDAILRYAERNQFHIAVWLEERETAAKQGRPIFNQALKLLRTGKAQGIILHKLDRGARNLKDWAAIGELSDQGVEIHFVNESLDLHSRGGRLSADIQAVVASDFIRNLKEETRKGQNGRLKQGVLPWRAPIGYLDQGKGGKLKIIDPVKGPLIRRAFELYGTGRYSLESLSFELHKGGLQNHNHGFIDQEALSLIFKNSFYFGVIHVRSTGESFPGKHDPLIRKSVFDRVQEVMTGKFNARSQRHDFTFRRLLTCRTCRQSLIGELQKGNVYYRCHEKTCPKTSLRQEVADTAFSDLFRALEFNDAEKLYFRGRIVEIRKNWVIEQETEAKNMKLKLGQTKERLNRLTDALLDGTIDKGLFHEKKGSLLAEQKTIEEKMADSGRRNQSSPDRLEKFLELVGNARLSHELALLEEKREMLRILTSNRLAEGKQLDIEPSLPFREIANRFHPPKWSQPPDIPRTWDRLLKILAKMAVSGELPDLTAVPGFQRYYNNAEKQTKG